MPCRPRRKPSFRSKANAGRRHRIPEQRIRATNWAEYHAALRGRGSLTLWFTDAANAAWKAEPRTTRGEQPHHSALEITEALTLRATYRLALRQAEGLIGSILSLCSVSSWPCRTIVPSAARPRHRKSRGFGLLRVPYTCWWRQHGAAAVRAWRVAGRKAREQGAPALAQAAHRCGRRHRKDRRIITDGERRR